MTNMFVIHSDDASGWVISDLIPALRHAGIQATTKEDFQPGSNRLRAAEQAIAEAVAVVAVVSPGFLKDAAAQQAEIMALTNAVESGTWNVVPLVTEDNIELPASLSMLVGIDAATAPARSEAIARLTAQYGRYRPWKEQATMPEDKHSEHSLEIALIKAEIRQLWNTLTQMQNTLHDALHPKRPEGLTLTILIAILVTVAALTTATVYITGNMGP
jgi:hypothetical protein